MACRIRISMRRFNFGSLESEPRGLADMYRVLSDAQVSVHASSYLIPAGLQTRAYAEAILGTTNTPDLADARAGMRIRREQILHDADVPDTYYLGAAALHNLHFADKHIMLELINHVQLAVEADIEAGAASRSRVGIVSASYVKPLPDLLPEGMSLVMPQDIRMVGTENDVFVMGNDQFEVDHIGEPGLRGAQALRRQAMLGRWADVAVFGEAALPFLEESRAALLTA
jgi:hypothetical protein